MTRPTMTMTNRVLWPDLKIDTRATIEDSFGMDKMKREAMKVAIRGVIRMVGNDPDIPESLSSLLKTIDTLDVSSLEITQLGRTSADIHWEQEPESQLKNAQFSSTDGMLITLIDGKGKLRTLVIL